MRDNALFAWKIGSRNAISIIRQETALTWCNSFIGYAVILLRYNNHYASYAIGALLQHYPLLKYEIYQEVKFSLSILKTSFV
jgi:hypothetical protein